MKPDLLKPLESRLALTLEWAHTIEQTFVEACRGMTLINPDKSEMFMGIRRQVELLTILLKQVRACQAGSFAHASNAIISEQQLFGALCNAYSFYPANQQILGLLRYIWIFQNRESFLRLANDANRGIIYVHLSCQMRLNRATDSVESFGHPRSDECHLIVVGNPDKQAPGFSFHYQDGILRLPVSDWYESLYQKSLYSIAFLATLLDFERLFKLDDDVFMLDRKSLDKGIKKIRARGSNYAGSIATNTILHCDFKGWHVNKCHDKAFESQGLSHCSSGEFAEGGLGYQLSHRSARVITDAFISNPMLYGKPCHVLPEDSLIGTILSSANIYCDRISTNAFGLQIKSQKTNLSEEGSSQYEICKRVHRILAQPNY